jgi:hypothetical protein
VGERYRVSENNNTLLLNLHHVTRDDVGYYSLTAKNAAGEARRAIEIKVEDAGPDVPVFLRRLSDLAVKVGTRTRFLVEIRSSSEVKVSERTWNSQEALLRTEEFRAELFKAYFQSYKSCIINIIFRPCKFVKLKVKLSLCLTEHHAMKTYWGVEL